MPRKFLLCLIPLFILSCNFLLPQSGQSTSSTQTPLEVVSTESAPSTPEPQTAIDGFVIVRIHKTNGDLLAQLAAEAQKAQALGLDPFIEFDATWCPPCRAIEASIQKKDSLTMNAFEGIYLIRADVDEWDWGEGQNFSFEAIPVYYKLDKNGQPTGDVIDGGAWNEDIPENFAPVLDEFFHGQ